MRTLIEAIGLALGDKVASSSSVHGGDTATALRVELASGLRVFAKTHPDPPSGFFTTEAAGLTWLREASELPIPEVLAVSDGDDEQPAYLVLPWIERGAANDTTEARFGRSLARLHAATPTYFGREFSSERTSILVVDDDGQIFELVSRFLRSHGFRVHAARDGREMQSVLAESGVDLIVLDLMLPGANGLDSCRELRKTSAIPVVMLTAKGDEVDRIIGLEVGADDYLPKPFNPRELLARVNAVLRRTLNRPAAAEQENKGAGFRGLGRSYSEARAHQSPRHRGRSFDR